MATAKNKRGQAARIKRSDRKNISVGQANEKYWGKNKAKTRQGRGNAGAGKNIRRKSRRAKPLGTFVFPKCG